MADRADIIARACRSMERAGGPPGLAALAKAAGMSPSHFHRTFTALMGVTPKAYAAELRARNVRNALSSGAPVTNAMYRAGFRSSGRFYETSGQTLGMKPSAFRAGGKGEVLRFAVGECSLGSVLVAASSKGICAITLGGDPDALARDLQDRFPRAELVGGDKAFERTVARVVGLVERPSAGLSVPLDIRGTAFQRRVWQALRRIPPGTTATYADIARSVGMPKAVRAVAQACGANAISVAIPCHRVVRTDGSLSGYRWGVERKAELLKREGAML